jgi:hypothetical protein
MSVKGRMGGWPVGLLCSRNARPSLRKKVKAEAEVEQRQSDPSPLSPSTST